jgi:hypothetical protein
MSMTRDEVLALPVTVDLLTTAHALGIGRSMAYEMARTGTYPVPLFKVGQRYRAMRADLLAVLGIADAPHPALRTVALEDERDAA